MVRVGSERVMNDQNDEDLSLHVMKTHTHNIPVEQISILETRTVDCDRALVGRPFGIELA